MVVSGSGHDDLFANRTEAAAVPAWAVRLLDASRCYRGYAAIGLENEEPDRASRERGRLPKSCGLLARSSPP